MTEETLEKYPEFKEYASRFAPYLREMILKELEEILDKHFKRKNEVKLVLEWAIDDYKKYKKTLKKLGLE